MENYTLFQKEIEYGIPEKFRENISLPIKYCGYIEKFLKNFDEKYEIKERS